MIKLTSLICLVFLCMMVTSMRIVAFGYRQYTYEDARHCLIQAKRNARDPVLVLDIDDTALDIASINQQKNKALGTKLVVAQKGKELPKGVSDVHSKKEDSHYTRDDIVAFYKLIDNIDPPVITSIYNIYKFAKFNDIKVIFVTARGDFMRHVTERNLINAGYGDHDGLYMNLNYTPLIKDCSEYKDMVRKSLRMKGHDIIGNIGDKDHDLAGDKATCMFKM